MVSCSLKVGDYVTLTKLEITGDGRDVLSGILQMPFEVGGISLLRNKKKLINTGLINKVEDDLLYTAGGIYKIEKI